ncbi:cupredoxin domain-containing protein [Candidatus Uhrbacteria bacterium]|nr:cupredoxin domain-containing protein [Candidatus Uhrbacteria bacterium]
MKKTLSIGLAAFVFALSTFPAIAASTIPASALHSGDLIRGTSLSGVYFYGEDGLRYVFPNDKTYFTWYSNFNSVKWLSDADLATIQIGGNVTYKPGVKMVKINSDPKVYAVGSGGTIRAVASEAVAKSLYGATWNKQIDDVPDGFFSNYKMGSLIELASQYSVSAEKADATNINADKNLKTPTVISIGATAYSPSTTTIESGTAVRFVNTSSTSQSASEFDSIWGTGTLKPGEHFTRYFKQKGTWTFYSKFVPQITMTGAIIVK